MATDRYTRHDRTQDPRTMYELSATTLSGVCSSWRRLAIETPSLWSYIDIIIGGARSPCHQKQPMLWIERSQNTLLYVTIQDQNYRCCLTNQYAVPMPQIVNLVAILAPIMHRVRALDTKLALRRSSILPAVMECWVRNGSPNIEKTLQILNRVSDEPPDISLGPADEVSPGEFNAFFRSVKRLVVQNCWISQHVLFHEGLVELHLQGIDEHHLPSQQEFVSMLAACPRLHILALANFPIEPSKETPNPVTLAHLESLSLESDGHAYSLIHVLPLLATGSNALDMSLTLDDEPGFAAGVKAFFSRTKVTRLFVSDRQRRSSLAPLFCPIPYLETLAIEHCNMFGQAFQELFESNEDGRSTVPWPCLHTLYLKDLPIDTDCLQKLVLLHRSLKKLHVFQPYSVGSGDTILTDEECDHLVDSMNMVEDFGMSFDWSNGPLDTWEFVILEQ
ncbi:hypothetical protein FRC08_011444 [Ceratobasidium sp. 394]|nr:hypothetical protein FRC08_011444 [Ceratobasidium sp. 394]